MAVRSIWFVGNCRIEPLLTQAQVETLYRDICDKSIVDMHRIVSINIHEVNEMPRTYAYEKAKVFYYIIFEDGSMSIMDEHDDR